MGIGETLDGLIAPFAPGWAANRQNARNTLAVHRIAGGMVRQYDAAQRNRRTANWPRVASSADGENARGRSMLAFAGHDLVRNNKYAAAGVRQMVATIWGDGITPQFEHSKKTVRQRAQDEWERWAESKVDGLGDWYGVGKLCVREMIVGGESLAIWQSEGMDINNRVSGVEGVVLDMAKTMYLANGNKVVQGVEFDESGRRIAYWLFDNHPNDLIWPKNMISKRVNAEHVDHVFERTRLGQTRGTSWLGSVAMTLRDIGEIEDATRLREKVQACLALIIQPGEGNGTSPLGVQSAPSPDDGRQLLEETLRPGMIGRLRPGETISVVNPQPSTTTVDFIRQQIAAVSANMVPYHLMTGDVSQANYSGLRAAMNGSYSMVDDWQQNEIIPLLCRPAALRQMQRLHVKTGNPEFLEVKMTWALPVRRLVDPVKDLAGEIMEIRAGLKTIRRALGERGINDEDQLTEINRMNTEIDRLGLALDTDPRRVNDSGSLQAAAGYLAPRDAAQ